MDKFLMKVSAITLLFTVFLTLNVSPANAVTEDVAYEQLANALESETEGIYAPYYELTDKMFGDDESVVDEAAEEFWSSLSLWKTKFEVADAIYANYINDPSRKVAEIAKDAKAGSEKGLSAIEEYETALTIESWDEAVVHLEAGDSNMFEAVTLHDQAVDSYNEYSGANESVVIKNILYVATAVFAFPMAAFFVLSKKNTRSDSEKIRADFYKRMFNAFLLMTGGVGFTAITYSMAADGGGTYFIMYGPVIGGIINLVREISNYFKVTRKEIKQAREKELDSPVRMM